MVQPTPKRSYSKQAKVVNRGLHTPPVTALFAFGVEAVLFRGGEGGCNSIGGNNGTAIPPELEERGTGAVGIRGVFILGIVICPIGGSGNSNVDPSEIVVAGVGAGVEKSTSIEV
ncbi:hypothetical protein AN958_06509 [Leucoagaricus sp. SymC.cos]|nr:hypothetical protein AN958_06509 [Leucoagaricus sp. SymC.cos]